MFLSYLDRGFPRSRSTSRIVKGRFLLALCLAARKTAALVLFGGGGFALADGLDPGTVRRTGPELGLAFWAHSVFTLAVAADGVTSSLSKLNSLWESRSRAL
jgi:hypothetical protein